MKAYSKEELMNELYELKQIKVEIPVFDGSGYSEFLYFYKVICKSNNLTVLNEYIDYLNSHFIFLEWQSYLVKRESEFKYEIVIFTTPSLKEMNQALSQYELLLSENKESISFVRNQSLDKFMLEKILNPDDFNLYPTIIKDSDLLGLSNAFKKYDDLSEADKSQIHPQIKDYFDVINFDNKGRYIISYSEGNATSMYKSFDMHWFYPNLIDYVALDKYSIDLKEYDAGTLELKDLLSEEDYIAANTQYVNNLNSIVKEFDQQKFDLFLLCERLYYVYSKNDIRLLADARE